MQIQTVLFCMHVCMYVNVCIHALILHSFSPPWSMQIQTVPIHFCSTPVIGLGKNATSIVLSTSVDKRTIPDGLQKMAICKTPMIPGPPSVRVDVSGTEWQFIFQIEKNVLAFTWSKICQASSKRLPVQMHITNPQSWICCPRDWFACSPSTDWPLCSTSSSSTCWWQSWCGHSCRSVWVSLSICLFCDCVFSF